MTLPFCPKCRAEYEDGFDTCGSCGVALVQTLDEVPGPMTPDRAQEELKDKELVGIVRGGVSACKEVCEALLSLQIPTIIAPAEEVDPRSGVAMVLDVLVAQEDLENAIGRLTAEWEELLQKDGLQFAGAMDEDPEDEIEEDQDEEDDEEPACPACGSKEPLEEGECPNCGLFLGP